MDTAGGTRTEKDTFGPIQVPAERLWGAQTQRSLEHFAISTERVPLEVVKAMARIKKLGAGLNRELAELDPKIADAIARAADEVLAGVHDEEFPLSVWQTGSGTQTQHERQRGARQPRQRAARRRAGHQAPGAPQRRREPQPVLQRHLPHRHVHRGAGGAHPARAPGAGGPGRGAGGQVRRVAGDREDRAHPPAGRDAAHPGPGGGRLGPPAPSGAQAPGGRAPASGRARAGRHRGGHRTECAPGLGRAHGGSAGPGHRAGAGERAGQVRGALGERRAGACARRAQDARGLRWSRSPTTCAGWRAAPGRDWASSGCRRTSRAAASCRGR